MLNHPVRSRLVYLTPSVLLKPIQNTQMQGGEGVRDLENRGRDRNRLDFSELFLCCVIHLGLDHYSKYHKYAETIFL